MTGTETTEVPAADAVGDSLEDLGAADPNVDPAPVSDGATDALEGDFEDRLRANDRPALTASGTVRAPASDDAGTGRTWKIVAGLGVAALAAAVAVVVDPGLLPRFRTDTVRTLRQVALVLGGLVGLVGLLSAYHRDDVAPEAGPADVEQVAPPAGARSGGNEVPGGRLDDAIDAIGGRVHGTDDVYTVGKVRSSLRGLAIRVIARTAECSRERAADHVDAGSWTEDVRAAAFLAGDEGPDLPLSIRIRDWASGRALERQVEATVDELAARMEVDDS